MGQVSVTTEGATRRVTMSQVYVTGLACAMASVRQMSQVWHVVRQMSQVWHVSWRLCVRCHGVRASDVMSRNVKTTSQILDDCCCFSPQVVGLSLQRAAFQLCK